VPLVIEVAAALIRDTAGRYLITQRRRGSHLEGLWEFPGGKQEAGESPETCLKRELAEELSASFAVGEKFTTVSQRLKLLHRERLIVRRRDGNHIYYALADRHVVDLILNALAHANERKADLAHATQEGDD